METTFELFVKAIEKAEKTLIACDKEIEYLTHHELYGSCLSLCNTIVINKERMMTITTDENHKTTYEFAPLYPTYFSPDAADKIQKHDIYKDINGNRIKLEKVGKLEYYKMLKNYTETGLKALRMSI